MRNGCTAGTADDSAVNDDTSYYKWRCAGSGGGTNDDTCEILKSSVIAGACASLVIGTVPSSSNACTAGSFNDSAVADDNTYYKWRCAGSGGGANNDTCKVANQYDFTNVVAAGNAAPRGIWSNDTTMWVVDADDDKIYAYNLSTKSRDSSKDFNTLSAAGNNSPYGLWSNGTTMWVVDISDRKIYAYSMSTKARDSAKDFTALASAGNTSPRGIWSNGTTMWVSDFGKKIYAYKMSDKTRDAAKEFTQLGSHGINKPRGIWSDSTTLWVSDYGNKKFHAYSLTGKTRIASKDITSSSPSHGLWSNGVKIWGSTWNKVLATDL